MLMSRAARILTFVTTIAAAGACVGPIAGGVSAAGASTLRHGLGAEAPAQRVAPPRTGIGVLSVPPASVDLRAWAVTPGDQGAVGSCVAWAIDYGMLGWYARRDNRPGQPFAPMYTYSQINGGRDAGSSPQQAFSVALNQGSDTRAHYTQGDYDWWDQPTAAERANAAQYKIKGWQTLFMGANQAGTIGALKQALAAQKPVAITMAVRNGFDTLGSNPAAVDDDVTSGIRGYHEVLALGYDASGLLIQNSWGTGWADGGFGRLSWRVVQNDVWEGDTIDGFVAPPPPVAPRVVSPALALLPQAHHAATDVVYRATWRGQAGTSGAITRYYVWLQTDGRFTRSLPVTDPTATSYTINLRIGHTYRIAVRGLAGGSLSATGYSAVVRAMPPTPPRVVSPALTLLPLAHHAATDAVYRATWRGQLGTSGPVTHYYVWLQTDGRFTRSVPLASATATTFTMNLRRGHTYRIAVRALAGGSLGATSYSAIVKA